MIPQKGGNGMNILISVNEKYLDKAETMLLSLRRTTKEPVAVYLMTHCLTQTHISRLEKFLTKHDMGLCVVDVSHTGLDNLPLGNRHFSVEMYYRILAQFLLPDCDRVLWLDADIVIRRDLKDFYSQSFDGKLLCACPDKNQGGEEITGIKKKLKLPTAHTYFNSGVLLLDLQALRRKTSQSEILALCRSLSDRLTYPDQDILNVLYHGRVKYCDWKIYNYQVLYERKIPAEALSRIAVMHYAGETKPWDYHYVWPVAASYYRVQLQRGRLLLTARMYLTYWLWAASFAARKLLGMVD